MPEGPEAHTMKDGLQPITGLSIIGILGCPWSDRLQSCQMPLIIQRVWVYGKRPIITCQDAQGKVGHFYFKLAMTGVIRYFPKLGQKPWGRKTKIIWEVGRTAPFGHGKIVEPVGCFLFDDVRGIGHVAYVTTEELQADLAGLGPDILSVANAQALRSHVLSKVKAMPNCVNWTVAKLLLDQSLFCGVGNYLRSDIAWEAGKYMSSEIAFQSGILPLRQVKTLTTQEWESLFLAAYNLIHESYRLGGYSKRDYVRPDGSKGGYKARVYGKTEAQGVKHAKDGSQTVYWDPSTQR